MGLINQLLTGKRAIEEYQVRNEIIENICHIINAKSPIWLERNIPENLNNTIIRYGINNPARSQGKYNGSLIIKEIEQLLTYFEPRFSRVTVTLAEEAYQDQFLRFIIRARLKGAKNNEYITFDSHLDFSASLMEVIDYYEE